jgi:hypothetical protein
MSYDNYPISSLNSDENESFQRDQDSVEKLIELLKELWRQLQSVPETYTKVLDDFSGLVELPMPLNIEVSDLKIVSKFDKGILIGLAIHYTGLQSGPKEINISKGLGILLYGPSTVRILVEGEKIIIETSNDNLFIKVEKNIPCIEIEASYRALIRKLVFSKSGEIIEKDVDWGTSLFIEKVIEQYRCTISSFPFCLKNNWQADSSLFDVE